LLHNNQPVHRQKVSKWNNFQRAYCTFIIYFSGFENSSSLTEQPFLIFYFLKTTPVQEVKKKDACRFSLMLERNKKYISSCGTIHFE
jgi:hypothetical protein